MKKHLLVISLIIAGLSSCTKVPSSYEVKGTLPDSTLNGKMLYMMRFDDNVNIDSTVVNGADFIFTGTADKPDLAAITALRKYYTYFVLENGNIEVDFDSHAGSSTTPLNTELNKMLEEIQVVQGLFNAEVEEFKKSNNNPEDEMKFRMELYNNEYEQKWFDTYKKYYLANNNNPVGVRALSELRYCTTPEGMDELIAQAGEWILSQKRVKSLIKTNEALKNTAVGKKFTDFTIEQEDGISSSLSDYVGKGKYVLVDFWASWCGPCIREVPTIKETYNEYKDKGLEVLGVAVWDKPADTKEAIGKHQLPWPQIINGQSIPTELYGINGIPHIILFGPDGTILARDLRGAQIKMEVAKAIENK